MVRVKKLTGIGALGLSTGAAALTWGYTQRNNFQLREYTLPLLAPGVLDGRGEFRVLHVSDLHMIPGQRKKVEFVSSLDALEPDLVVNTGDNLSDIGGVPWVLDALGPLLNRPGAFVFGTNDYWAPRPVNPLKYLTGAKREPSYEDLPWEGMRAAFVERGWQDATHARLEFKASGVRLALAGVDDPHHELDRYSEVAGAPHEDADLPSPTNCAAAATATPHPTSPPQPPQAPRGSSEASGADHPCARPGKYLPAPPARPSATPAHRRA